MTLARIAPRTRSLLGTALVAAALLLAAAPTEALAAEIIVKTVKIKKRTSSILRVDSSEAVGRFEVGELSVTTTTETRDATRSRAGASPRPSRSSASRSSRRAGPWSPRRRWS
jgi:hypothetical protein